MRELLAILNTLWLIFIDIYPSIEILMIRRGIL